MEELHSVAIVVDSEFGTRLLDLSNRLHVWICHTPGNVEAINKVLSKNDKKHSLESGITSFTVKASASPQDMFLGVIDNVDLHHGEYSRTPPWSVLEVYGVKPSIQTKSKLEEYGPGSFTETKDGFTFIRKLQSSGDKSL